MRFDWEQEEKEIRKEYKRIKIWSCAIGIVGIIAMLLTMPSEYL